MARESSWRQLPSFCICFNLAYSFPYTSQYRRRTVPNWGISSYSSR